MSDDFNLLYAIELGENSGQYTPHVAKCFSLRMVTISSHVRVKVYCILFETWTPSLYFLLPSAF